MRVTLELHGRQPVTGLIEADRGEPRPFAGWLALLAVLEQLVDADSSEAAAGGLGGDLDPGGDP